eukprot:1139107-Pelagomonas_calceolata.AAC.5
MAPTYPQGAQTVWCPRSTGRPWHHTCGTAVSRGPYTEASHTASQPCPVCVRVTKEDTSFTPKRLHTEASRTASQPCPVCMRTGKKRKLYTKEATYRGEPHSVSAMPCMHEDGKEEKALYQRGYIQRLAAQRLSHALCTRAGKEEKSKHQRGHIQRQATQRPSHALCTRAGKEDASSTPEGGHIERQSTERPSYALCTRDVPRKHGKGSHTHRGGERR